MKYIITYKKSIVLVNTPDPEIRTPQLLKSLHLYARQLIEYFNVSSLVIKCISPSVKVAITLALDSSGKITISDKRVEYIDPTDVKGTFRMGLLPEFKNDLMNRIAKLSALSSSELFGEVLELSKLLDTATIYVFANLRAIRREELSEFFSLIKAIAFEPVHLLLYSKILLIIIDNNLQVPEILLSSNNVLYRNVFTTDEDVELAVSTFVEKFEKVTGRRLSEAEVRLLKDLLKGLTVNKIQDLLAKCMSERKVDFAELAEAKAKLMTESLPFIETVKPLTFDDIGGYEPIKELLRKRLINLLSNYEKALRYGLKLLRGVLFFGPPGTGKSTFAKAIAGEAKLPVFKISETIFSSLYGETERNLKMTLDAIERATPCILFIDECDRMFAKRGSLQEHEVTRRIKNILLEYMADPNRRAIIVATTNLVEDLDEAFLRPERIETIIPVFYPDTASRKEILKVHLRDAPTEISDEELNAIAEKTAWWNGDELRHLCHLAKLYAFEENAEYVTIKHLEKALEDIVVDVSERKSLAEKVKSVVRKYVRDRRFIELIDRQIELVEAKSKRAESAVLELRDFLLK